jgi:CO/xanthine dehydrogenase FAD-binding subunit
MWAMKLPPFDYRVTGSVEETLGLLAEYGDDAKILAGGQSLLPLLAMRLARPAVLIDINKVGELFHMSSDDGLTLGAMTRQRTAERSEVVRASAPMLTAALRFVGHDAIRTRGTVGGSAAHADPAAEVPTVLSALDASIVALRAGGARTLDAESFFEGFLTTSLESDELLSAIHIPPRPTGSGWAFNEFSRRHGDVALVGAAVTLVLDDTDNVLDCRIFLSGVAEQPSRAGAAEAVVRGSVPGHHSFAEAARAATDKLDAKSDLHGSSEYRRHLAGVLIRRCLVEALGRAKGNR